MVTIESHLMHTLHMTRLLALEPQAVSGAAEINGPTGLKRFLQRLRVHPSEHQHILGAGLLSNDRQEPLCVPTHLC